MASVLPAELTSWELVIRTAEGDQPAGNEFARRYEPFIRRVLHRRWAGTSFRRYFDDAVQETFVQCYRTNGVIERADPDRGASVRTLLYSVAQNVARRYERDHESHSPDLDAAAVVADPLDGFTELTRAEARATVQEALRRLCESDDPDECKYGELLRARTYDGLTAKILSDGDPAVAAAIHRAYAKAKRRFEESLIAVVSAAYPIPPAEVRLLLMELLAALE